MLHSENALRRRSECAELNMFQPDVHLQKQQHSDVTKSEICSYCHYNSQLLCERREKCPLYGNICGRHAEQNWHRPIIRRKSFSEYISVVLFSSYHNFSAHRSISPTRLQTPPQRPRTLLFTTIVLAVRAALGQWKCAMKFGKLAGQRSYVSHDASDEANKSSRITAKNYRGRSELGLSWSNLLPSQAAWHLTVTMTKR